MAATDERRRTMVLVRFMATASPFVIGVRGAGGAIDGDAGAVLALAVLHEDRGGGGGAVRREVDLEREARALVRHLVVGRHVRARAGRRDDDLRRDVERGDERPVLR